MGEERTLESVVWDDPNEMHHRIDAIRRRLRSDDPHERVDAGRAFRAAAEEDPELIGSHLDTVIGLLSDENGSLQLSGAIGIARLAEITPETVDGTVPELIALLERTHAPAIRMAAVRALTRIGEPRPRPLPTRTTLSPTCCERRRPGSGWRPSRFSPAWSSRLPTGFPKRYARPRTRWTTTRSGSADAPRHRSRGSRPRIPPRSRPWKACSDGSRDWRLD